jgi:choice-of-anchor B domain-containing protein
LVDGSRLLVGLATMALVVAVAVPSAADPAKPGGEHPEESALAHERTHQRGEGMPSVRGPFPDTVNMEFLGQLTNAELGVSKLAFTGASFLSDIWGWTTTNADTLRNFWWDIKTFNNHAYITTEVNDAGVAIFELTKLDGMPEVEPGTPAATLQADARYTADGYIRAHNISINEATGFAYLTGVSKDPAVDPGFTDDGTIILDLNGDPLAPVEVGQILNIDSHDAQVVSYEGPDADYAGREIAILFNGTDLEVAFYDVTDKDDIVEISKTTYPGASFTHQGWLTEDAEFLLVGDEEDELFGLSDPQNPDLPDTARTYIFDVRDLDAPTFDGFFDSPAASIDHNLFVKGNRVYQAHYTAGIRVLSIEPDGDGIKLDEVAHMDTEPRIPNNHLNNNINIFVGPWGVFPFFESGSIIASDGLNGLIIMRLDE